MLFNRFFALPRRYNYSLISKTINFGHGTYSTTQSAASTKNNDDDLDAPIKYSSSPAHNWQAKATRTGGVSYRLWYEPYVISVSIVVFLVYFTMIREENDVDQELTRSLYSRIDGLEEQQLQILLAYNKEQNKDTTAIINRLKELEDEKNNM